MLSEHQDPQHAVAQPEPVTNPALIEHLNAALATEITCVLRYKSHYFNCKGVMGKIVREEFAEHADQELVHMTMLAERISDLGGSPNFSPEATIRRSHVPFVTSLSVAAMIAQNLQAELVAVESYRTLIQRIGDNDPTTRRMLESILAQEEEHLADMRELSDDSNIKRLE